MAKQKQKSKELIVEGVAEDTTTFSHLIEVGASTELVLNVKRIHPDAKLPTVAHPGEDLAYDLYAVESVILEARERKAISTGIIAYQEGHGLLLRDRSSMASRGLTVSAGVIDAGYRGELKVLITNNQFDREFITKGDKIAQAIPVPVLTGEVVEVHEVTESNRGDRGFGSSGR